ncbi:MAG: hypothetical protein ACK456_03255 [Pseudanabaenaceae cyanobacterium]|jgi:hypothetical protein
MNPEESPILQQIMEKFPVCTATASRLLPTVESLISHYSSIHILDHFITVYAPYSESPEAIANVQAQMCQLFGGVTSMFVIGGWLDQQGNLLNEDILMIKSFLTAQTFAECLPLILSIAQEMGVILNQEAVSVEVGNSQGSLMLLLANH